VSFAFKDSSLIGHAYFLRIETPKGRASWVVQLVVHENYRGQSIGTKLLHSVWGFSNDYAWGLATSNPLTVKTLESATIRKVFPKKVKKNLDTIHSLGVHIPFIEKEKVEVNEDRSIVDTQFFVDHSKIDEKMEAYSGEWKLGELPEGFEWIAFTFKEQDTRKLDQEELDKMLEHSDSILKEAYSRMEVDSHQWNKHTAHEVEFILSKLYPLNKDARIGDFGCGFGRHLIELHRRGFENLFGIDFSESNILHGKSLTKNKNISLDINDCRYVRYEDKFDLILCLYDVIGSFPDEFDNYKIIENISRNLKPGGLAAISVMNMELTESLVSHKYDVLADPKPLFNLSASNTMQSSGNIFNPDYMIIDVNSNLVYRKEMFENENQISAEYIIRDRRYKKDELIQLMKKYGFEIQDIRFVQAGKWNIGLDATDHAAKEILVIVKKVSDPSF